MTATPEERAWAAYVDGVGATAYAAKWENMPDRHKTAWKAVVEGAEAAALERAAVACENIHAPYSVFGSAFAHFVRDLKGKL